MLASLEWATTSASATQGVRARCWSAKELPHTSPGVKHGKPSIERSQKLFAPENHSDNLPTNLKTPRRYQPTYLNDQPIAVEMIPLSYTK